MVANFSDRAFCRNAPQENGGRLCEAVSCARRQDASRFRLLWGRAGRSDYRKRIGRPDMPSRGVSEIRCSGRTPAVVKRDSVRKRCWLPSGADIVRVPGKTLKTLKIKGRAWLFEKLCVYLRAFVPGCVRTYADAKAAKTRETKTRRIFFGRFKGLNDN